MHRRLLGFTLIELCVTVAVAGVLLAIAVPAFTGVATVSTIRSLSAELSAHSYLARSEAIKRNRVVRLCASSDAATCDNAAWSSGWIVLVDGDVIERRGALPTGFTIVGGGNVKSVMYRATGYGASGATLTVCRNAPQAGAEERVVTIDSGGKAYVKRTHAGICA